jgi:hypothetical protein
VFFFVFCEVLNVNSHYFHKKRCMGDFCHGDVLCFLRERRRFFNIRCTSFKILPHFCYTLSSAKLISEFKPDAKPDRHLSSEFCQKWTFSISLFVSIPNLVSMLVLPKGRAGIFWELLESYNFLFSVMCVVYVSTLSLCSSVYFCLSLSSSFELLIGTWKEICRRSPKKYIYMCVPGTSLRFRIHY